jgi:DNA mismatch repair protein MutS2
MNQSTLNTLEVDTLIGLLAGHVQTPLGRTRAQTIRPLHDSAEIDHALDLTSECRDYLDTGGGFGLSDIQDPSEAISALRIENVTLTPHQVLNLERVISVATGLRGMFNDFESRGRYPRLFSLTAAVPDLRRLLSSIRGRVLPSGEIDDNASPELRRIRREINERRGRVYRSLESLMREQVASIQEEFVTIRNGRFVIPVRTDSRGQIQGVVHGLSSSGQTTYLEPLSIINQNNEMVRLHELEEIEIAKILFEITDLFRINLPAVEAAVHAVGEVDFIQAKARLSREFNCIRPRMTSNRRLILHDARHVLLDQTLRRGNRQVVPISLELDDEKHVMVISGPNAGGKTVVLKTVGLSAIMAQMGLHVAASAAELPVFDDAFADVGDQQSIAANLSTFTAHMRNVSDMARCVTARSLVLLDEVGTGTDPDEGAALAVAIVDYFKRSGAVMIATTHYNELKMWVAKTEGVLNASVEFDERTLQPTYRLISGVAGASSGLEIARRMELPEQIIEQAAAVISPSHGQASDYLKRVKSLVDEQEALRAALEDERRTTAEKYASLETEFERRESARRAEFERELSLAIEEFQAESRRIIESLRDKAAQAKLQKQAAARAADLKRQAAVRLRKSTRNQPETNR